MPGRVANPLAEAGAHFLTPLRTAIRHLVVIGVAIVLGACCGEPLFKERRVKRQEEAASTHVSVLSVAPFEDYRDALQAKFSLTAEQALDKVIPTTRDLEEKFLDALLLSLKLGLPTSLSTVTDTKVTTVTAEGSRAGTRERTVTDQSGPGDVSKAPLTADFAKEAGAATLGPAADQSVLKTPVTIEPMLRYTAANALFQEVQILNRYVRNAPTRGRGEKAYIPFVVRLQVSVMPMARHMPYDVFANVAFFCVNESTPGKVASDEEVPEVVPMLVTDNLEATMHSRSIDQVRQIAFGLIAMYQGVGASAEAQRKLEKIQTSIGRDLNSLLTVGKVSHNMLRVRLGAAQEVEANHALVPQTHNVTVLVLAPPGTNAIRLRSNTVLRDATRGKELRGRTKEEVEEGHQRILAKYTAIADRGDYIFKADSRALEELIDAAVSGDATSFNGKLGCLLEKRGTASVMTADQVKKLSGEIWWRDVLWEELVTFALGNRFSLASFDLPELRAPSLPSLATGRVPAVVDNGEVGRVLLTPGKQLRSEDLQAFLEWNGKEFPPKAIKVSDSGRDVTVEFPSLAKIINADGVPVKVVLSGPVGAPKPGGGRDINSSSYSAAFFRVQEAKPTPGFTLDITSGRVDVVEGKGKILITVVFPDDRTTGAESATISLKGASLDSFETLEGGAELKAGKLLIKSNTRLRLTLSNVEDIVIIEAMNSKEVKVTAPPIQAKRENKEKEKEDKK